MSKKNPSVVHKEFYKSRTPKHDEILLQCVSFKTKIRIIELMRKKILDIAIKIYNRPGRFKTEVTKEQIKGPEIDDYSTEVRVNLPRTTFTIGWADLLFYVSTKVGYYHYVENYDYDTRERIKVKKYFEDILKFIILVEIKPNLDDVGAILRQIKTYREGLEENSISNIFSLIATYSQPPHEVIELLEHEGISVMVLAPPEKKDEGIIDDQDDDYVDPYLMK